MKTLDGMARDLFNKFSIRETGKSGDWNYLGDTRKLAWMEEVLIMANYFLKELKNEIKPLSNKQAYTSYESGYNDGIRSERTLFYSMVSEKFEKLVDEFEDFSYSVNNK